MFNTYFSAKYVLSKGALFNLVLSDRSDGKTFDCKIRSLEDYDANKSITLYVRRFKSEITEQLYKNFYDDVLNDLRPEKQKYRDKFGSWQFKGTRRGVQVSTDNGKTWDWIVFFIPLTMSGKMKSQLDAFIHRIKVIDFDEYIPLDDRYAHNEMTLLIELWKSIDRDRFITQLLILGNKITPYNPFMDYFGIEMQITNDKVRSYRNNTLAIQIYSNKEHRKVRQASKFNDLISGTPYEEYDAGGVLNALNIKVASHVGATYFSSFKTIKGEGTIWSNGRQFIVSSYQRKDGFVIVDKIYNTGREEFTISFGRFPQLFKRLYRSGQLYFEDEKSYHLFEDILKKVWN